jgi:hypothetical protein
MEKEQTGLHGIGIIRPSVAMQIIVSVKLAL